MLKFGGGGRSTLIGGISCPCPWATRTFPASIARAKGSTRWYTVGSRFMETLSCRAMRLALNNTVVFVQQASLSRAARLFGVALFAVLLAGGCRRGKKAKPDAAKPAATAELASVRPPPPPAESLPAPAGVPAPPRRGGTLKVHLDGEPPN